MIIAAMDAAPATTQMIVPLRKMDFRNDLHRIACPVLLMVGKDDPITPPVFSESIAESLRDNQLTYHRYSECRHGVIADKLDEAMKAVRDFVGRF